MEFALKKPLYITIAIIVALAAVYWMPQTKQPPIADYLQRMGGDFTLESASGKLSLNDFRGDVVLLYFGYAHCPDVCPTALNMVASAMHALTEKQREHVHGLFISLDPRRDSPKLLAEYTRFFDPAIIGVTGLPEELAAIASAWRVDYYVPDTTADSQYAVEHSNFIYLVNSKGKVAALFDERTPASEIAASVVKWL